MDILDRVKQLQNIFEDDPSSMAQEPRNMFADGQLVRPNDDGSRPGYGGKKDVDKINKIKNYINNQGDKIDAFEFKKFAEELGYKRPRGVIDNLELGLLDNVLENKTFINKGKRPSRAGFGFSKGQMTVLDKYTKLLNSQQPKKYTSVNFIELDDAERANILQRARSNDFKFKAKTKFDDLTTLQQQKVIEAFGLEQDAFDYDPSKQKNVKGITKFGVPRDDKRYHQIQRYVKNGFKFSPKDTLPIAKQRDIISRFELPKGFKDWDFKKYKYGIPSGGSASNPAYTKRIIDFVGGKTRFPNLAADAGTPQGWMMNQYYRTYTYEKERNVPRNKLTYKPIFETINGKQKVVGFVDNTVSGNGKTYFGIKKWNDKYNGNLLDTHFDFKNVKKFVDISKKAYEEPNEVIKGLLQKGGVQPTEKLQLKHILNFLAEKNGYKATESAIKIHHQSGVGAGGVSGEAVKDLQLLRSEVNSSIRQAETRIRNAAVNNLTPNVDDVNKLKSLGASIKVGGKIYGAGSQTAIGSFKEIEKQAISEIKDFNKKDFKQLAGYLEKLGCGQAAGGRILFSKGTPGGRLTDCALAGQKKVDRIIATGKGTDKELSIAKKLLKFGKESVSLRGLFGPQATALFALTEAGLTGYDVAKGKPLKEAIGKNLNYLLGPKWEQDVDELEYKRLEGSGVDINQLKLLKNSYKDFEKLGELFNTQYSLEQNKGNPQGRSGMGSKGTQKSRAQRLQEVNSQINDMYMAKGPQQKSTLIRATEIQNDPSILANRKNAIDILAAQEADRSILPEAGSAFADERRRKEKEKQRLALQTTDKEVEEAFGFNPNGVQTFSELNKLMSTMPEYADQSYGITKVGPQTGQYNVKNAYNEARKYLDSLKPEFGYYGTQEGANVNTRYAGGGIARLSGGDTSGPPPESGPMSQGLRSLYKNGRKL